MTENQAREGWPPTYLVRGETVSEARFIKQQAIERAPARRCRGAWRNMLAANCRGDVAAFRSARARYALAGRALDKVRGIVRPGRDFALAALVAVRPKSATHRREGNARGPGRSRASRVRARDDSGGSDDGPPPEPPPIGRVHDARKPPIERLAISDATSLDALGLSPRQFRRWLHEGIAHQKVGRRSVALVEDIRRALGATSPAPAPRAALSEAEVVELATRRKTVSR